MFSVVIFETESPKIYISVEADIVSKKRNDVVEIRRFNTLKDAKICLSELTAGIL